MSTQTWHLLVYVNKRHSYTASLCSLFISWVFKGTKKNQMFETSWFLTNTIKGSSFDTTVTKLRQAGGQPFSLKPYLMWQKHLWHIRKESKSCNYCRWLANSAGGATWKECDFPHSDNKKSKECICNGPQCFSLSPRSPPPKEKIFRFNVLTTTPQKKSASDLFWSEFLNFFGCLRKLKARQLFKHTHEIWPDPLARNWTCSRTSMGGIKTTCTKGTTKTNQKVN